MTHPVRTVAIRLAIALTAIGIFGVAYILFHDFLTGIGIPFWPAASGATLVSIYLAGATIFSLEGRRRDDP